MTDIPQFDIEDLLNRRADLSSFVVHFTRKYKGKNARDNLESIIGGRVLEARTPMGLAADAKDESQFAVSFTECPLEHLYTFVAKIRGKRIDLEPYGLAFTKARARELGLNPVWYVDQTPTGREWLTGCIGNLIRQAQKGGQFATSDIAALTPFFEIMQPASGKTIQKEFWWEREWRYVGNLEFSLSDIALGLCPENEVGHFENLTRGAVRFIDPRWSIERIIAKLAQVQGRISPFEPYA